VTKDSRLPDERADEALRQIGLIAVYAAALERNLAALAANSNISLGMQHFLKMSNKQKLKTIQNHLTERRDFARSERADASRRKRAVTWAEVAVELLRERGDLMHSEWIIARLVPDRRAPKHLLAHHLSSGTRTPVDLDKLTDLADRIAGHNTKFKHLWDVGSLIYPMLLRNDANETAHTSDIL
jgi:hypothetical protein